MSLEAERIHLRPQLTRARWIYLCGYWDFAYDDAAKGLAEDWQQCPDLYHDLLLPGYQPEQQPVMVTEYGGISYKPQQDASWFGYGTVTDGEAYLAKYRELTMALLDSPAIAGFCYTQLTDTGQETNGLLTDKRTFKMDARAIREINRHTSAAVPSDVAAVYHHEAFK